MKACKRTSRKYRRPRPKVRTEWPIKDVMKLINIIENHPEIWNINCPQYKSPKAPAWQDVAKCMGDRSADECKAKWLNLRISLNFNLRKREKFGSIVRWQFFNPMMFLIEMGVSQLSDSNSESSDDSSFCVEKTKKSRLAQEKYSRRSPPPKKCSSRQSLQKCDSRPPDPLAPSQEKYCEIASAPPSPLELSDDCSLFAKRTKASTRHLDISSRRPSQPLTPPPAKYCEIPSKPSSPLELSDDSSLLVKITKASTPPRNKCSRRSSKPLATHSEKYCDISPERLAVKYIGIPYEPPTVPQQNCNSRITSEPLLPHRQKYNGVRPKSQTHNFRSASIDPMHTHSHSNILKERRSMPICTLSGSTQNQDPFEAFGSYIVAELHSVPPYAAIIAKSKLTRALVEIMEEVRSMTT